MPNTAITATIRINTGGIAIVHKSRTECAHCGANVLDSLKPCPGCGVAFRSMAVTTIGADPDQEVRDLLSDASFGHLRHMGWAAGGTCNWRISADPHVDWSTI